MAAIVAPDAIEQEYSQRIDNLKEEQSKYRQERSWKGRIATKDSKYIQEFNNKIAEQLANKDSALLALQTSNTALKAEAKEVNQQAVATVEQLRTKLGTMFYWSQLVAELLYLFLSVIEWIYSWQVTIEHTGMEKKTGTADRPARKVTNATRSTPEAADVPMTISNLEEKRTAAAPSETADVPTPQRTTIGFKQGERQPLDTVRQVELVKKEYTRVCTHCKKGYTHNAGNQKYCNTKCKKAAARLRKA